jgi:hypothetical protein
MKKRRDFIYSEWLAEQSIPLEKRIKRKYCPYFERMEELRKKAVKVLKGTEGMTIHELYKKLRSFNVPTTMHLSNVLCKDPQKRFKSENKIWHTLLAS